MAGGTSLSKQIIRCERKAVLCDEAVAKAKVDLKAAIAGLRAARRNVLDVHRQLSELRQKRVKMDEAQVKRNVLKEDGLSPFRHICFSQLLIAEYENAGFDAPDWIAKITETDVKDVRTSALIEKYVVSSGMLSSLVDEATIRIIVDRIEGSMRRFSPGVSSEESKKIWDEHPDWNLENALAIASRVRKEFAISHDLAVDVGKRNVVVMSSWCNAAVEGLWINDIASGVAAQFLTRPRRREPGDALSGAAIETTVNRNASRSLSAIENEVRLMEAVAIFATPGAMAHGASFGLYVDGRKFSNAWFAANRNLISRHYSRIGSARAFSDVVADPEKFSAVHAPGAAPKIAQGSQFWARRDTEKDLFIKKSSIELIEDARHALIDTSLRSDLVSMPKNRGDFVDLGPWAKSEALHAATFSVGEIVTKGFLAEAREAAEVQVMQGSNPIAITLGLVKWMSADGVQREAPLFLAMASFDPDTLMASRLTEFNLNTAWLRRLGVEYPKLASLSVMLELPFGAELEPLFGSIAERINAADDSKPIVSIGDQSYVGVFDSSRSVLERRLNIRSYPGLEDNPIVLMLAHGTAHQLSYAPYTPQGGRSRPDEVQTLAVRAALGGSSFILEGPPGTGKTQTIFEMVRALSASGKRVLVTAAMPGAIEVVGRRMRGALRFGISSLRPGQIDVGGPTKKVDARQAQFEVLIGTPLAITKDLPGDDRFDVLIVDESSQMRLSHALAVAGHATQLVVVGDSRQLQPQDREPGAVAEQSLLMRARMAGLPSVSLQAHYRSQHRSLIAWSNLFSYDSRLRPQTGPLLYGEAGFSVAYVAPGRRVQRGVAQVNVEEASRIAEECLRLARDGRRSVGVAAMTQAQRDLIRETVEERMEEAGISAATAGGGNRFFSKTEPFFIRTAGAVQGEERDCILISLGIAPDKDGRISQNIGVLSRPDGLALCNVMLSRSRLRTVVYCSIVPSDLDLAAMTPASFLVASILRMGAIVGALEAQGGRENCIDPKAFDPNFDGMIDRLEMDGETFYGVRVPADADRYAFAICPREPFKTHAVTEKLRAGGWTVFGNSPQFLGEPKQIVALAREELGRLQKR